MIYPESTNICFNRWNLLLVFFSIAFGLVFGSFLNVVIYRLPRNQSIVLPRISCVNCKNVLDFSDLIPLFSWLILKGRCRYCQASISFRYPLIETLCSISFVLCIFASPSSIALTNEVLVLFAGWVLVSFLIALSFIDLDYLWLPSSLTLSAITSGITFTSISSLISYDNSNYIFRR